MITLYDIDSSVHSVEIKNAAGNALLIDASGHISINDGGNSITVDATNLDIRDLTSVSDSVEIKTAAGQALAIDGSGYITANINGTVTVSATNLDIRDLTHASDSVKVGDGTDFLAVNTDGSINVNSNDGGFSSWKVSSVAASTTAAQIAATPLTGRRMLTIENLGAQDVYLDTSNSVSTSSLLLPKNASVDLKLSATANIWAITGSGTATLRVAEFAV